MSLLDIFVGFELKKHFFHIFGAKEKTGKISDFSKKISDFSPIFLLPIFSSQNRF